MCLFTLCAVACLVESKIDLEIIIEGASIIFPQIKKVAGVVEKANGVVTIITKRDGQLNVVNAKGELVTCSWTQKPYINKLKTKWRTRVTCPGVDFEAKVSSTGRDSGVSQAGCQMQRHVLGPEGTIRFNYKGKVNIC